MQFEKLGSFYLGKHYDLASGSVMDRLCLYDARDLTTHAVCVGMTGSGKTGLCISLLEEAAIDGVPAIIIDPKGDITNLLLQFPELKPEDFRPWVSPEEARRNGFSAEQYAAAQAEAWSKGLAAWGQDGERIRLLKESADFRIYTPGSDAGVPVSLLQSFDPPVQKTGFGDEAFRERIQSTVEALLGLVGIQADPVTSREHTFLSTVFDHFWRKGRALDLRRLILAIQKPPVQRIGVFDVESFYPSSERFDLALRLNNIMASPSFGGWLQGEPLSAAGFLATKTGRPRHSIFYLAHLGESERQFFVAMLLNELTSWMRAQPGTDSLRALLYMDEIFGYFPPVANPPSKRPLLTLLKQARAYGVGVLLASQNPVDLDYKGLTNTGTWFIGRLQAERDKQRLLEGLHTVAGQSGINSDLDRLISGLAKRVFLLHNVHDEGIVAFHTRWALSYLRGPLTRPQIERLKAPLEMPAGAVVSTPATLSSAFAPAPAQSVTIADPPSSVSEMPPALDPSFRQSFLPAGRSLNSALVELEEDLGHQLEAENSSLMYRPGLLARGRVHFLDRRRKVNQSNPYCLLAPVGESRMDVRWDSALNLDEAEGRGLSQPEPGTTFRELPAWVGKTAEWKRARKDLLDFLYRNRTLELLYCRKFRQYSEPGESERDFKLRLSHLAREARDEEVDELNDRFEKKLRRLGNRLERAEIAFQKKQTTSQSRNREFLVSVGESLVGMFLGRRSLRGASSSLGKYRMESTAKLATAEAEERIEELREEIEALEEELKEKSEEITERWNEIAEDVEAVLITPRRTDVQVDEMILGWEPCWMVGYRLGPGERQTKLVSAL